MAFEHELEEIHSAFDHLTSSLKEMEGMEKKAEASLHSGELARADALTRMDTEASQIRDRIRQLMAALPEEHRNA